MKKIFIFLFSFSFFYIGFSQSKVKNNPTPTQSQLKWQDMEFYFFMHFGPNTFTGLEWGKGTENAEVFDPKNVDCDQWCRIAKAAGATGIIITAKHHDGFCLWPSKYSTHTVRESNWKNGKGDVLKELSAACKKYGLKLGVYLSPWDRNHPAYGTPKYNDVFVNMLKEIFSNYGLIWELWWDGANGEGPNGKKQVYDFNRFEKVVRKLSPNTIIFSDIGPDARWCGNEKGFAGKTNWNTLDTAGFKRGAGAPSTDTLNQGNMYGKNWIPAECDVSIRPGWFSHKNEDSLVKTPAQLFEIYLKSVGRGANLILNVPPDGSGIITQYDSTALMGFKKLRDESFSNNLSIKSRGYFISHNGKTVTKKLNDGNNKSFETITSPGLQSMRIEFPRSQKINCIILKENLVNGQHCAKFKILLKGKNHILIKQIDATTIGHKRIITFPEIEATFVDVVIEQQKGPTEISEIEAYLIVELASMPPL
ncbi:MAG: alpha-L-fucosidase [Bacteroidota bacterium]|nr:alpha-L-fucosidase [Bacteroidota bacterium]